MKLFFLIPVILIAFLSPLLLAQDCNNPLLNFFGIQGLEIPESGADLPYCESLKTSETCCSAETVAAFEDRGEKLVAKLNNYDAARDLYLAQLSEKYFDRFKEVLDDVNELYNSEIAEIRRANATLAEELQTDINTFNRVRDQAQQINDQFETALREYQDARKKCFDIALVIQASAWCLACDPNYATQGVTEDGSVIFSENLCRNISDACRPYFEQGARFNPLISMREAFWRLFAVRKYLNDFSENKTAVFIVPKNPFDNLLSTQTAVIVPEKWNGQDGMCQDLWADDVLLSELLTIGSPLTLSEEEGTFIEEEQAVAVNMEDELTRLLVGLAHVFATYDWDPNGLEPGFGLEVDDDPAYYYYYPDISDWFD